MPKSNKGVPKGLIQIDLNNMPPDTTDWDAIDAMTDEEIAAAANSDPDNPITTPEFWAGAQFVMPSGNKKSITIRVDADVLDFFRKGGNGYQKRMNAVLRSYYEAEQKKAQ